MSFTNAFNKKDYLEWMEKQIADDEVVVITTHISEMAYVKNTNTKKVSYQFPAFGFIRPDGLKDVLDSPKFAALIMKRNYLNRGLLDVVDGIEKEYKEPPTPVAKTKKKIKA